MELVYLWVEEYKNIKEQGFNFSPRFRCEYDKDRNELTIEENEDYIPNFFGENINVTAIVGKNGSGKSSLLRALLDFFENKDYEIEDKIILIVRKNQDINIFSKKEPVIQNKTSYDYDFLSNGSEFSSKISRFGILIDMDNDNKNNDDKNEIKYYIKYYIKYIEYKEETIYELISKLTKYNLPITSFMYLPHKIYVSQKEIYVKKLKDMIRPLDEVYGNTPKIENKNLKKKLLYYSENNSINILELFFVKLLLNNNKVNDIFKDITIPKEEKDSPYIENIEVDKNKLLQEVNKNNLNKERLNFEEFNYLLKQKEFIATNIKDRKLINRYKKFLTFDYEDIKKRKYSNLSDGEKRIYGQILHIVDFLKNHENSIFLFDEPTNSFHPEWQRKYISELLEATKNKNVHIVLTSHSPFLLSDIPSQNTIFLDTYTSKDTEVKNKLQENGNCKVVDGLKEKKQTFGANIHTLLSDSFFMVDGLMGEFAKSKIDELIQYLNGKGNTDIKSDDEAQKLINIIGEPIVEKQLQRMLDSKRLKKIEEIDILKKSIEDMQKRLEELENDKNSK